jgi:diaminopimelate epimerase
MSIQVHFYKYSVYGNDFILLDETEKAELTELEKSRFAGIATDRHFGIGADNLIVLQTCSPQSIETINSARAYWKEGGQKGQLSTPDYVFRVFESDGSESLCCGNALICIAGHLHRQHNICTASILTEVPSQDPKVRELGVGTDNGFYKVNLGCPSMIPESLVTRDVMATADSDVGALTDFCLPITCNLNGRSLSLPMSGFLTYTGEPHFVIPVLYQNSSCSIESSHKIFDLLFDDSQVESQMREHEQRDDVQLLHQIGMEVNFKYPEIFPHGINIDFAKIIDRANGIIEYRCFERGVYRETFACGTGAIAIAVSLYHREPMQLNEFTLLPKRSRSNKLFQSAQVNVRREPSGEWWVECEPKFVFSGFIQSDKTEGQGRDHHRTLSGWAW